MSLQLLNIYSEWEQKPVLIVPYLCLWCYGFWDVIDLKCTRWLQKWSTANLQAQFTASSVPIAHVNDAELISMDVTVSEWRKLALFGTPHMYDCIKNINLHILLVLQAAVLLTINVLLCMMRAWLVVPIGVENMQSQPQFLIIFIYLVIWRCSLSFPYV